MQISIDNTSDLGRKLTVEVPAADVDKKIKQRLQRLSKTAKLDGFRPGKVPSKVVEQRYGASVRIDVLKEVMQNTLFEALKEKQLRMAGMPHVEPQEYEAGKPFIYAATFEVYPNIELKDFSKISIQKLSTEITDKDIDNKLAELQKNNPKWEAVKSAAKEGDQLVVDFTGTVDGKPLEGGSATDMPIELGTKRMIPGFEDGLMGAKAGDERKFELTLPENYPAEIANKVAVFQVKVKDVKSAVKIPIGNELAEHLGIEGGEEALRKQLREAMERELKFAERNQIRSEVVAELLKKNSIKLPNALVDEEVQRMQEHIRKQMGLTDKDSMPEMPRGELEDRAQKHVSLRLLFAEIIKQEQIKIDAEQVRNAVKEVAQSYQKPEEVEKWYYQQKDRLAEIEARVLEEQVVGVIAEKAKVKEKQVDFEELLKASKEQ